MVYLYIITGVVIIAAVFLFLVFPSGRRHKDTEKLKGLLIAHRGLFNNNAGIPENSMMAFSLAVSKGYAIETDLRLTADGEVVIFHDNTLERMCGLKEQVDALTLAELKKVKLLGTENQIPTLKEFLSMVNGRVMLVLEFKCTDKDCDTLCRKVNSILTHYKGDYCMESFYPGAVQWYKNNRKDIMRGQLAMKYRGKKLLNHIAGMYMANCLSRPDFAAYDVNNANSPFFKLQKLLGAFPVGWTYTSQKQLEELKSDFEAYIFEGFEPQKNEYFK